MRTVNASSASTNKTLPDELIFDNECVSDSKTIATELNDYFASIAKILNTASTETSCSGKRFTKVFMTKFNLRPNLVIEEHLKFELKTES